MYTVNYTPFIKHYTVLYILQNKDVQLAGLYFQEYLPPCLLYHVLHTLLYTVFYTVMNSVLNTILYSVLQTIQFTAIYTLLYIILYTETKVAGVLFTVQFNIHVSVQ